MAQLRPEQLEQHLAGGLAPVYLVAGEEPLILEESLGRIRQAAFQAGYAEREVLHGDGNFDWNRLLEARDNLSLFAQRRLIELRLPGGKPGQQGSRVLQAFAAQPPEDTLLIVATERLEARQRNSGWAANLASAGVMVYAWPVRGHEMPRWIEQRMRQRGLMPTSDAVSLLAQRAEGNLLAGAQEIEKLTLIQGQGEVDEATVRAAVVPNQRYDVFDLPAAARTGDRARTLRIANSLREADEPPTLVLWALARDLRVLVELQSAPRRGDGSDGVFGRYRIPRPQQSSYTRLAARSQQAGWDHLLARAARADALVKGAGAGRPWDELIQLADDMACAAAEEPSARHASGGRWG
jgi:DNA polymerase-3 subunit delta